MWHFFDGVILVLGMLWIVCIVLDHFLCVWFPTCLLSMISFLTFFPQGPSDMPGYVCFMTANIGLIIWMVFSLPVGLIELNKELMHPKIAVERLAEQNVYAVIMGAGIGVFLGGFIVLVISR